MSTTYSSRLVVGVSLGKLYKEERYTDNVTKYNPDTGVPIRVPVEKIRRSFGNIQLEDIVVQYMNENSCNWDTEPRDFKFLEDDENSCNWDTEPRDFKFLEDAGIGLHVVGRERGSNYKDLCKYGVVGLDLKQEASVTEITDACVDLQYALAKLGYPNSECKVYGQLRWS